MILECNSNGCTLSIHTPKKFLPRNEPFNIGKKRKANNKRKNKIQIWREQLVRADNIKWDPRSDQLLENYGVNSPTYASNNAPEDNEETNKKQGQKKNKYDKYKHKYNTNGYNYRTGGPDKDGNYDSYVVILRDPLPTTTAESSQEEGGGDTNNEESSSMKMARQMQEQHNRMTNDPNSLANRLAPYAVVADGGNDLTSSTEYIIHLRDFNIGYTRRLARTVVSKINAYVKGRRSSFIIREARPVPWQGLVMLIVGIFSFVLCLLIGQFWEDSDPTKDGSYKKRMTEIKRRKELEKYQRRNLTMRQMKRPRAAMPTSGRRTISKGN